MGSCAQWLSWKCQMSSGTAREHVRVARALRDLPVIRARFAAGRLSYAKVRALTRIATPATEAGLAELAGPMTANQLERFARAHRQVTRADDADARVRRRLAWRVEEDGSLSGTFRLPPLQGAVLLKALRAACADLAGQRVIRAADVSAETPAAPETPAADTRGRCRTSSDLADGLVAVAESFLAGKVAGADDAEVYQVVVHAGTGVLTEPRGLGRGPGVSAETPAAPARVPGDPADPARCHVEDGPAISVSTAQMLACTAALVVDDPRRRRRRPGPGPAAAPPQLRDPPRRPGTGRLPVPVPGLRVPPDRPAPHPARLLGQQQPHRPDQPRSACAPIIPQSSTTTAASSPPRPAAARSPSLTRDCAPLPSSPPLPEPGGGMAPPTTRNHPGHDHPALVRRAPRPEPRHLGLLRQRQDQGRTRADPDGPPRGRVTIYDPEDCDERYRQYLERAPRYTGATLIPIQV